ncbi:carbon monoxide dehydrogenase subunit G [Sneathiella marina]|uniref:Carbon monoxide dehydrogenase subunit G n=1 Tax=Sneathiella marina TaxID=2950108 RepID=A0ABY4VY91_9PROT|nr:carbon monoxide dehydrogenase subunit G [Sneathiella marina]USG59709.1 carbon monoxide dehydrogenase subunit G [Sneathiella marina]
MQMNGEELISASRERVWEALNDPEILRQAIPGCESVEKTGDDAFAATVKVKIGPVKATFKGDVTLSNIDAPNGYTITGEGKGGAAGFGKGGADITLKDADNGTLLAYDVNASVGGKMAQIGSRLIDGTAKKLAGEFFTSFNELVSNAASDEGEVPATAAPSSDQSEAPIIAEDTEEKAAPQQPETPSQGWMKPSILIPLGIVAAIILYYLAG